MSIVIENLTHIYMKGSPFERNALNNVTLKINTGEFVGIIGHTGSGKSTLVQHLNGLLKPTAGRVIINDIDTSGKNLKELRQHVGIIFQYPEHQLFEETVYKDIAFGLIKQGLGEDEIKKRVYDTLSIVGVDESILQKSPFELSGGQKRRVAIAGVLVMNPGILVLDEPTAGLDPKGRDEVFKFISGMHKRLGITIVLVSHSMEDIARFAERVIVMNKGMIEMDGTPADVFKDVEKLESVGLSAPQITYLIKKLKKTFPNIADGVFTVEEAKSEIMKYLRGVKL
ncbi:MAG: energy-coupling factor transporter ATPase [Clostridia bacterium]|nr:energy-coupling factor transporter ATPase [Clostridia bacterium]